MLLKFLANLEYWKSVPEARVTVGAPGFTCTQNTMRIPLVNVEAFSCIPKERSYRRADGATSRQRAFSKRGRDAQPAGNRDPASSRNPAAARERKADVKVSASQSSTELPTPLSKTATAEPEEDAEAAGSAPSSSWKRKWWGWSRRSRAPPGDNGNSVQADGPDPEPPKDGAVHTAAHPGQSEANNGDELRDVNASPKARETAWDRENVSGVLVVLSQVPLPPWIQ
ncbi:hypothetical protein CYMTET_6042, partial [Cymbomonas tetramitiformis]